MISKNSHKFLIFREDFYSSWKAVFSKNIDRYSNEVYLYCMTITIIRTKEYSRFVSRLPLGKEIDKAEEEIVRNPDKWPVIKGTSGIRKARFAIGNKGKRGGGRIWYFYLTKKEEIYLLRAYLKNEKEDLTETDKSILKQSVRDLTNEKP